MMPYLGKCREVTGEVPSLNGCRVVQTFIVAVVLFWSGFVVAQPKSSVRSAAKILSFCAVAMLLLTPHVRAAQDDLRAFQGAWVHSSATCDEVFATRGKSLSFRHPANVFQTAIIISGRRLSTPGATCRIRSVSSVKDRTELSLSCATAIAEDPAKVQFQVGSDGALYRYSDDSDKSGIRYERCAP
jgi:hypothetical protein